MKLGFKKQLFVYICVYKKCIHAFKCKHKCKQIIFHEHFFEKFLEKNSWNWSFKIKFICLQLICLPMGNFKDTGVNLSVPLEWIDPEPLKPEWLLLVRSEAEGESAKNTYIFFRKIYKDKYVGKQISRVLSNYLSPKS